MKYRITKEPLYMFIFDLNEKKTAKKYIKLKHLYKIIKYNLYNSTYVTVRLRKSKEIPAKCTMCASYPANNKDCDHYHKQKLHQNSNYISSII